MLVSNNAKADGKNQIQAFEIRGEEKKLTEISQENLRIFAGNHKDIEAYLKSILPEALTRLSNKLQDKEIS